MESELVSVAAVPVGETRVEIRERREGRDDIVISIPRTFVPTIIQQLSELASASEESTK